MLRRVACSSVLRSVIRSGTQPTARTAIAYTAPQRDIKFIFKDCLGYYDFWKDLGKKHNNDGLTDAPDTFEAMLEEASKLFEKEWAPCYQRGDEDGAKFEASTGDIKVTPGFQEALNLFNEGGWAGVTADPEYGGMGLPYSIHLMKSELAAQSNWPLSMWPMLSSGCMHTVELFGTKEQKDECIPKLASGEWAGTMCLTEPSAGTDLAQIRSKAVPRDDGTFEITGDKIFISSGEHDMQKNIIHIVLARLPDAPAGVKGISLFLVPKYLDPNAPNKEKNVLCVGIEKKMGIHGNPTCVMKFDKSIGTMIGKPNDGVRQMFTFMNHARLAVGIQGFSHAETSYQNALAYARERMSGRFLNGTMFPDKAGDPIIVHPDIRRMVLFQRYVAEVGRWIVYFCSKYGDQMQYVHTMEEKAALDDEMGYFVPIAKAFLTELGCEAASHGIQIYGGHGYIREYGMEQIYRDARIATLYEGTTGVQAADLIGRKTFLNKLVNWGKIQGMYAQIIDQAVSRDAGLANYAAEAKKGAETLNKAFGVVGAALKGGNKAIMNAVAVDNLFANGYLLSAVACLDMAGAAAKKLADGGLSEDDTKHMKSKQLLCNYFFSKVYPRFHGHIGAMTSNQDCLTDSDISLYF